MSAGACAPRLCGRYPSSARAAAAPSSNSSETLDEIFTRTNATATGRPPHEFGDGVCSRRLLSRLLATVVCLVALPAVAEPAVWLFPAVGRRDEVTVSGRVLKEAPRGQHTLSRNVRSLTAEKWEGAPVTLALEGQTQKATSSSEGDFTVTFSFKDKPLDAGIHFVEARVPGAVGKAGVQLLDDAAPFLVISDLDDTLSVTNVLHKKQLAEAALLEDGNSQPAVPG